MWGTVLAFGLWAATDPTRLVIVAVLMSRLRPRRNLVAYWLGGLAAGLAPGLSVVALLLILRDDLLSLLEHARFTAARFTGGYVQIAVGLLALTIAALVSAGVLARRSAGVPTYGGPVPAPVLQPPTASAWSRLTVRVRHALQDGNPWVAFGVGLLSTMPPLDYLVVLAVIVTSRVAIGSQISAVVMFTVVVLALVEIPLVSYLVMPAKTEVAVVQLQKWASIHRRRILIVVPAAVGVLLVAAGIGSL